jgi:HK97 family phage prohead protease
MLREIRYIQATECRAVGGSGDADPLRIEGYASVFNTRAQLPGFREQIKPGAFTRALTEKQDVVCLFNHDANFVLGRTTSGTLTLRQDARGLFYSCELPNTQTARDLHTSIQRGDINGCSFAFTIPDGGQSWSEAQDTDGSYFVARDITDLNLHDVSPVTYPCYSGTEVYARNCAEVPVELRSAVDSKNAALVTPPADIQRTTTVKPISLKDLRAKAHTKFNGEKREIIDAIDTDLDSFEDAISEVCKALNVAFPAETVEGQACPYPCGRFYECETYEDFVIVVECSTGANFQIQYVHDESKPVGEQITFGAPVEVEKVWVPSDRTAAKIAEFRKQFPVFRKEEKLLDDMDEELDEDFDRALIGRDFDPLSVHDNHTDDGDCAEGDCRCQNRWAPTGSGAARGVVYTGDVFYTGAEATDETRGGFTRTKRVAGKDLTAKSFAYVGDPDKTETWKLPIHDASHVRNALARFSSTDLPADAKAGVLRKIHAAAKKFGIEVSEEKAVPWAMEYVVRASMAAAGVPQSLVRYAPEQPRKYSGKFGSGKGEDARSSDQHNFAAKQHLSAAMDSHKDGDHEQARCNMRAADQHMRAEVAQKKVEDAGDQADPMDRAMANSQSKTANAYSAKC